MNVVADRIQAIETADSSDALLDAVRALSEERSPEGLPTLIKVLSFNNPGAAVAAVEGLVDLGKIAVEPLLNLDRYNYGARAWAVRALAQIGDPRGLETLLDTVNNDFSLSVRRAAAKGLGKLKWGELDPDRVTEAQQRAFDSLYATCDDPEWIVRYACIVGLEALANQPAAMASTWRSQLCDRIADLAKTDSEIAIRARARYALSNLIPARSS